MTQGANCVDITTKLLTMQSNLLGAKPLAKDGRERAGKVQVLARSRSKVSNATAGTVQTHLQLKSMLVCGATKGSTWENNITPKTPGWLLLVLPGWLRTSCWEGMHQRVLLLSGKGLLVGMQRILVRGRSTGADLWGLRGLQGRCR